MEILIIGGGVIGLSIARELKRRGVQGVRIVEKGRVGREASWAAAGILSPQAEADEDGEFFRLCYESNKMYRAFAAELLAETGVDIELDQSGVIFLGFTTEDDEELQHRFRWQRSKGLNVELLEGEQLSAVEPQASRESNSALLFPDDGQVENRKLVEALAASCRAKGVSVEENTAVESIVVESGKAVGVLAKGRRFDADVVVVAAGAWSSVIEGAGKSLPVSVKPIRGQMLSYMPNEIRFGHVLYSRNGYLVPRRDGRLLAGATAEDVGFDKTVTAGGTEALKNAAEEICPSLRRFEPAESWAGLRPYADGGLPFIGPVPDTAGLFAAVGHFRNGILLAPITAGMIADAVLGTNSASYTVSS